MQQNSLQDQIKFEFIKKIKLEIHCKILHLWTFVSLHNILIQFNDFSLTNEKWTILVLYPDSGISMDVENF